MLEKKNDIWEVYHRNDLNEAICIPTNGVVEPDGCAVMGRGVAGQATRWIAGIAGMVGEAILENGSVVQEICPQVIAFPTKPIRGFCAPGKSNVVKGYRHRCNVGGYVPGWAMMSDLAIIAASLDQLEVLQAEREWERVYLPRPGCGAGGLDWQTQVKPLCERTGDWLIVVHV